ncbi:glycosyltransferase [Rhodocytophaga rosea]|uniref:Glycosyltransferase n=1 Tax=Rhodocytophaga rosea TaxID=2704465 RepID=A0A6C0GNG7_9BACT|nr:glycosyltransferase [Rhodocytophaga rosea]QHT69588.1 glycosyltransferase [Rhodocytophaga rosea]
MNKSIAIIVIAYNRPNALRRLLSSLESAYFEDKNIPLIISIDKSDSDQVEQVAKEFKWPFGDKRVIVHPENLGLRKHVISCGDLTYEYDNVIMLEDDLFVSPYFYDFTKQANKFYKDYEEISGISLYAYDFNEHTNAPFTPIEDGYDTYFMQIPSSIGQFFTRNQWNGFSNFLKKEDAEINDNDELPDLVIHRWPSSSWKKYFYKYMVVHKKYFVYPRISFTTNFGDVGTHFSKTTNNYQVNLLMGKRTFKFSLLNGSSSIYDNHYEIIPEIIKKSNKELAKFDFVCDLYGLRNKNKVRSEFMISAKECYKPIMGFALEMSPQELNICFNIPGNYFHLGKVNDFSHFDQLKRHKQLAFDLKMDYDDIYKNKINLIRKEAYNEGRVKVMHSTSFKLGKFLLYPFHFLKRNISLIL